MAWRTTTGTAIDAHVKGLGPEEKQGLEDWWNGGPTWRIREWVLERLGVGGET